MPEVSVIIPAYNAERWLPETLESVAEQQCASMEVIIIDDGSTDRTAAYVEERWPQFKLVRTENRGVSHARNLAASLAGGEFIQYLDADDVLMPNKINRHRQLLADHPEVDAVYANWQRLEQHVDGSFALGQKVERAIADVHPDPEIAFFHDMWCPTGSYFYRRAVHDKIGPWKDWLPVIQDARFALDCTRAGARWLHDPNISVLYRQHRSGSISTRSRLAFQRDVWANTQDIERLWEAEGTLHGERRDFILGSFKSVARVFFELDSPAFEQVYAHLLELEPHFRPTGKSLARLASLIGYRNAERIALWYRQAKSRMALG